MKDYVKQAIRTEAQDLHPVKSVAVSMILLDFIEACQAMDKLKRALFYGAPLEGYAHISPNFGATDRVRRLLHAALGLGTEAGEVAEAVFGHVFEGKPLNAVNIMEELGDMNWYEAIALDELGITLEETLEKNIAKLKARFPDKFTEREALHRDLTFEEKILQAH